MVLIGWIILSSSMYVGEMDEGTTGMFNIIKETYLHYKQLIVCVFSFFVIWSSYKNLGTMAGNISMAILALIYFGVLSIDVFKMEKNTGHLVNVGSDKQAIKTCSNAPQKNGWFSGGGRGGRRMDLTNQLKSINKNMRIS